MASATMNIEAILDMQHKLYRWSRNDPARVFSDLFNLVCDRRTLQLAWKQLSTNKGGRTPGIDGVHRRRIEERPGGVAQFLDEVREELRSGTYQPQPVRQHLIPKPGKPGHFRPLGIPTLKDRLVQMALKIVLEPIFEADFYPTSYGFRRGRSTHDALAAVQMQLRPSRNGPSAVRYIIEGDIKGCFDNIDHHVLMERVRRRIGDRKVLRLILAFLKAGIMAEGSVRHPVAGTPQGGIISPLLANILLTALEERYRRWTPPSHEPSIRSTRRRAWDRRQGRPTFYLIRYADDFLILVSGSREDAEAEKLALSQYLRDTLRLELSLEKTAITAPEDGFDFLGYRVVVEPSRRNGMPVAKLRIPKGKLQLLRDRLKTHTSLPTAIRPADELMREVNYIVRGWRNYYRYATGASREFAKLDRWLWQRIRLWLKKKHKGITGHDLRRRYARQETPRRWTWGAGEVTLRRFSQGGTTHYRWRGAKISNGWNDVIDGVHFYPEVPIALHGFTWTGEWLR